jgi:hypothetical protein
MTDAHVHRDAQGHVLRKIDKIEPSGQGGGGDQPRRRFRMPGVLMARRHGLKRDRGVFGQGRIS